MVEKAIAFLETKAPGCRLCFYRRSYAGEARRRGTRAGRQRPLALDQNRHHFRDDIRLAACASRISMGRQCRSAIAACAKTSSGAPWFAQERGPQEYDAQSLRALPRRGRFRKRAYRAGPTTARTGLRQVAETYDALADGVELKRARAMRPRAMASCVTGPIKSITGSGTKFPTKEQPNERIVTGPISKLISGAIGWVITTVAH